MLRTRDGGLIQCERPPGAYCIERSNGTLAGLERSGWFCFLYAHVAQLVEHVLGKDEVSGSIPLVGSSFCDIVK
jgi:hypothetical protein